MPFVGLTKGLKCVEFERSFHAVSRPELQIDKEHSMDTKPFEVPLLEQFLDGFTVPDWLAREYDRLSRNPDIVCRAAAVGMVINRFIDPETDDRGPMAATVRDRVKRWIESRDEHEHLTISKQIVARCVIIDRWSMRLRIEGCPPSELLALCQLRELLQDASVAIPQGYDHHAARALCQVDEDVMKRLPLGTLRLPSTTTLLEVARRRRNPSQWWAHLNGSGT
jgi:hypothetical protein